MAFSMAALGGIGMEVLLNIPPDGRARLRVAIKVSFVVLVAISCAYLVADHREFLTKGLVRYTAVQYAMFFLLLATATLVTLRLPRTDTSGTQLAAILLGIELLSFLSFVPTYNPVIRSKMFYPTPTALKYLQDDKSLFRVLLPFPNLGDVYDLSDITGYDGITPGYLAQLLNGTKGLGVFGNGILQFTDDLNSQLASLVNLKYALAIPGAPSPGPEFHLVYHGPDGNIFRNGSVFPRAFLARRARTCLDDATALAMVRGTELNLKDEVVIDGCPHVEASDLSQATPDVELYEPERVVVRTSVKGYAFLVLTDSYDAGWHVQVDGREVPLLRADYAFRAVALSAGSHRVEFLYRPRSVFLGVILSMVGLILIVTLVAFGRRPLPEEEKI
jgi:hypothetical protein